MLQMVTSEEQNIMDEDNFNKTKPYACNKILQADTENCRDT